LQLTNSLSSEIKTGFVCKKLMELKMKYYELINFKIHMFIEFTKENSQKQNNKSLWSFS
jgi:hypothetical protein